MSGSFSRFPSDWVVSPFFSLVHFTAFELSLALCRVMYLFAAAVFPD